MPAIPEPNNLGDLLKYEAPNRYSRDVATIAAGQNLPLGTVLGRNASDGKRPHDDRRPSSTRLRLRIPSLLSHRRPLLAAG